MRVYQCCVSRLQRIGSALVLLGGVAFSPAAWAASSERVFLEDLTWTEVRGAVQAGKTTVIIPIGGTEQNGPHMGLGKHNVRVKVLAGKIASALGNALVAPVVAYVPEGNIDPAKGHMRFPGTISISAEAFKGILDGAARSLKQHGFIDIVLIGDHGGYQSMLKVVVGRLNRDWASTQVRAHFVSDYYRASDVDYVRLLQSKGLSAEQIGLHAGVADTSLMMATDVSLVRQGQLLVDVRNDPGSGVVGDPRVSSVALGELGVNLIVSQTVLAIRIGQNMRR